MYSHPLLLDVVHSVADEGNEEVDEDDGSGDQVDSKQDHGQVSGCLLRNFGTPK